jgi:hypothetical protein
MRVSGPVQAAVMEMGTRMKMQGTKRSGKPWTSLGAPSMEVCFCRLQTLSVSCEGKVGLVSALETPGWAMRDASTAPPAAPRNAQFSSMPHGPHQSNAKTIDGQNRENVMENAMHM